MMGNVAVSYGAKGILWFWGGFGWGERENWSSRTKYVRGLMDLNYQKRHNNVYGEWLDGAGTSKFNTVRDLNILYHDRWGPAIMSFKDELTNSYIYRDPTERSNFLNGTYFNEILTYEPIPTDFMIPAGDPDPINNRYLQAATFRNEVEPYTYYFMLVNKRCSPYRPEISENGGRRDVVIKLDASHYQLGIFNNWKIVNLENNSTVYTFDKNNPPATGIDLGWYLPGEGRLYKVVPVMVDGGTFVCDEVVTPDQPTIVCSGIVNNGGHNLIIYPNSITFTFQGMINMEGGSFQANLIENPPGTLIMSQQNATNNTILSLNNCYYVRLYSCNITSDMNSNYLIAITNPTITDVRKCNITCPENAGGIGFFATYAELPARFNLNISEDNHFNMNANNLPALLVSASGSVKVPLLCSGNDFNSQNSNSATAISLMGVSGGILQYNNINGFDYGILANSCNMPLLGNAISSDYGSVGIFGTAETVMDMRQIPGYWLGLNNLENTGVSNNINVEESYFLMNTGYNIFNISSNPNAYHLYGTFPQQSDEIDLYNVYNCFKIENIPGNVVKDVHWSNGPEVEFTFEPYGCTNENPDGILALDFGDGIIDSMAYKNGQPQNMYDSLGLEMRKRHYLNVISISRRILDNSPDSLLSIDAVSKLYTAKSIADTTNEGITALKDYFSNVILTNPNNPSLIRGCNYHIQKCKVLLRQYASAMAGFQAIIDHDPYSYEALVAHWDYMATHLLDSLSGGSLPGDGDDDRNSRITKEQKVVIKENIRNAYEEQRNRVEKRILTLKEKALNGDEGAKKEINRRNALKDVVQVRTPHNILEHIQIVNEDIKKIFNQKTNTSNEKNNLVPSVYRLAQNYPNPFNPITTIKYELPKDSRVKLVVYDLLGREIKTLVNEIKPAGYYQIEFNMQNYASGVYFYRIDTDDLKGKKFVDAKKMVLVK